MSTIQSTPFKLFRDENIRADTKLAPANTDNLSLKGQLGVPKSTRKALGNVSESQINIRQTPAHKPTLLGKPSHITNSIIKPKNSVKVPLVVVAEESQYNFDPSDLVSYGAPSTYHEDPVGRMLKLRNSGKSIIDSDIEDIKLLRDEMEEPVVPNYDDVFNELMSDSLCQELINWD